jgi:hypothetical protein
MRKKKLVVGKVDVVLEVMAKVELSDLVRRDWKDLRWEMKWVEDSMG